MTNLDNGLQTKQPVSKVTLMMKDRALDMGRRRICLAARKVPGSPVEKEEKGKEKENAKEDSKWKEEHSLVKNEHRILNGSQKMTVLGGQEDKKGSSKGEKIASLKVVFTLTTQKRMQVVITAGTKAEARNEKERGRKVLILNLVFQPLKQRKKKTLLGTRR